MAERRYSNRELDFKFTAIQNGLQTISTEVSNGFVGVHARQDKTNGNITNLKIWRAYITGAITVLSFFIGVILIPIVAAYIQAGRF